MSGNVIIQITQWDDGTFSAENPHESQRVTVTAFSLPQLLARLGTKAAMKSLGLSS